VDRRARSVITSVRSETGLSAEEFAERVSEAGFEVSGRHVEQYEKGTPKGTPLEYVQAICRAFGVPAARFFPGDTVADSAWEGTVAERQLAAIRAILSGHEPPIVGSARSPHDPEALRRRFLTAISDYSDLEVERACRLNHETVRQYRQGQWPKRGPNAASKAKMETFIELHEKRRTVAATAAGELPRLSEGLISFAEEWRQDEAFGKQYPNQGWVAITDAAAAQLRELGLMRYDDEIAWLAYKRAVGYDPESADSVTLADVGLGIDPFVDLARQDPEGR